MFRTLQLIKEPIHFRIINLLRIRRLTIGDLQKVLNIPAHEIGQHIKALRKTGLISCDLTTPPDLCRISDSFIESNSLFYEIAIAQMNKTLLYQDDLIRLEDLKEKAAK